MFRRNRPKITVIVEIFPARGTVKSLRVPRIRKRLTDPKTKQEQKNIAKKYEKNVCFPRGEQNFRFDVFFC